MKKLVNIIGFQSVWWGCVFGTMYNYFYLGPLLAIIFITIHMKHIDIQSNELKLILYISILGTIIDTSFIYTNLLHYEGGYSHNFPIAPLWITSMWAGFAATLNHSMSWLKNKYLTSMLLGVIFGPLAYISGQKLGVIHFLSSYDVTMAVLAILWGLAMPTMYLINDKLNIDD